MLASNRVLIHSFRSLATGIEFVPLGFTVNCSLNKFVFMGLTCQPSAYTPILEDQGVSLRLDPPVGRDYEQLRYRRPAR
jgi:hypothetical protein